MWRLPNVVNRKSNCVQQGTRTSSRCYSQYFVETVLWASALCWCHTFPLRFDVLGLRLELLPYCPHQQGVSVLRAAARWIFFFPFFWVVSLSVCAQLLRFSCHRFILGCDKKQTPACLIPTIIVMLHVNITWSSRPVSSYAVWFYYNYMNRHVHWCSQ